MKRLILLMLYLSALNGVAQSPPFRGIAINSAEFFVVGDNATLAVDGHILLTGTQADNLIKLSGTIECSGDLRNNAQSTFINTAGTGKVRLVGDSIQNITGTAFHFPNLEIAKSSQELILKQHINVDSILKISSGDLKLNGFNINLLNDYSSLKSETNEHRIYGTVGGIKGDFSSSKSTNIHGLGLTISGNQGLYKIERNHAFAPGASTKGGVLRSYKVTSLAKITTPEVWTVDMSYFDAKELRGLNETKFSIFSSTNGGLVWKLNESSPNVALNKVVCNKFEVNPSDSVIYFTLAETKCDQVPTVTLGADTQYVCKGDSLLLDAQNIGFTHIWTSNVWAPKTEIIAQKIKVTNDGVFYVKVRDANGCVGFDSVHVYQKPYPVAAFTAKSVCQNDSTVFVNTSTLTSGSKTNFWDFGDTKIQNDTSHFENPRFRYDTAGIYTITLTVKSDFNCVNTIQHPVTIKPLPIADFSVANQCLKNAHQFKDASTIQTQIGTNQFSITKFHWDFGTTKDTSNLKSPSFIYPKEGLYSVELQTVSNGGCRDTIRKIIEVFPRATVDFSLKNVCLGNDVSIVNNTVMTNVSYKWNFADGLFSANQTPSKIYTKAGDYNVKLVVTTANLCADSLSKTVSVYELPKADFSFRDTCEANSIALKNNSTSKDVLNYRWNFGDNTFSTIENPAKNFSTAKDYAVKLVAISDKQCADSSTKSITIHPNPVLSFDFVEVCAGKDVSFKNFSTISSGTISYLWDFNNGNKSSFKNPVETFTTARTYAVNLKGTSAKGCVSNLNKPLEIFALPVIDIPSSVSTCTNSMVLDAGNTGSTFLWSDNSTAATLTVTKSGTYAITVTSPKNCVSTNQVEVALNSTFKANFPATLTSCDKAILDAGNPGSISYTWSTGEKTRLISVSTSGIYTLDVVDQNNCPGKASINVTVNKSPVVDLGKDISICSKDSYTLTAPASTGTYLWSTGETTPSIKVTEANLYSVKVTSVEKCSGTSDVNLKLFDLPKFSLGQDRAMCDSITLVPTRTGTQYLWSDGSKNQLFWTNQAGTYWLELTDQNNCLFRDSVTLSLSPKPIVALGDDKTICEGEQVSLDAQNSGSQFEWQDGTKNATYLVSSTGLYKVKVSNKFNCSKEDEVRITVAPKTVVALGEDQVLCSGQELKLDAGNTGSSYKWENSLGIISENQFISIKDSGTYWVNVLTPFGCKGLDSIHVRVSKDTISADYLAVSTADVGDTIQFISLAFPEGVAYNWYFDDGISSTAEDPQHIFQAAKTYKVSLTVSNQYCSKSIEKEISIRDLKQEPTEESIHVSFNEIESASAYPNPTSGLFTLEVKLAEEGTITVLIYDLSGHKLDMFTATTDFLEQIIDLSNENANLYLVKVVLGTKSKVLKVLKY